MSRHRDVRCMNYSDEYDGYDDVYGHSVEDDYCTSPSAEQFMYDRNKQANIASFITEPDIVEGNEEEEEDIPSSYKLPPLSDLDAAKLMSCLEAIKNVIGDTHPESELNRKIIEFNYNTEAVLDSILNDGSAKKDKDEKTVEKAEPQPDCISENSSNHKLASSTLKCDKQIKEERDASFSKIPGNCVLDSSSNSSFSSLADLTAHHLAGKSSNSLPKFSIPKMNFGNQSRCDSIPQAPSVANSLFGLISQQSNPFSSQSDGSEPNASEKLTKIKLEKVDFTNPSFSSLADLTAHHLKISNDDDVERKNSSTPGFIIPKNSAKTLKSDERNTPSSFLADLTALHSRIKKNDNPPSHFASQVTAVKVKMEKFHKNDVHDSVLNISNLNIEEKFDPLKVIKLEPLDRYEKISANTKANNLCSEASTSHKDVLLQTPAKSVKKELNSETCKALRTTKVSSLGKVLCKSYCRKVPYPSKVISQKFVETGSVVRFDFSSPSPDQIILDRLRITRTA